MKKIALLSIIISTSCFSQTYYAIVDNVGYEFKETYKPELSIYKGGLITGEYQLSSNIKTYGWRSAPFVTTSGSLDGSALNSVSMPRDHSNAWLSNINYNLGGVQIKRNEVSGNYDYILGVTYFKNNNFGNNTDFIHHNNLNLQVSAFGESYFVYLNGNEFYRSVSKETWEKWDNKTTDFKLTWYKGLGKEVEDIEKPIDDWTNEGTEYNCSAFSPLPENIDLYESFEQTKNCSMKQVRNYEILTKFDTDIEMFQRKITKEKIINLEIKQNAIGTRECNFVPDYEYAYNDTGGINTFISTKKGINEIVSMPSNPLAYTIIDGKQVKLGAHIRKDPDYLGRDYYEICIK